ncbi:uncharacterized protein LOC143244692 isoform X2 [Tachypleus tridentatus]
MNCCAPLVLFFWCSALALTHGHVSLSSSSKTYDCPETDKIEPCSCSLSSEGLSIYCRYIQSLQNITDLVEVLKNYGPIYEIELLYSELQRIPKLLFKDITFKVLSLSHLNLDPISEEDAPFLENNSEPTEEIYITESLRRGSGNLFFSHFTNLKILEIIWNSLDVVDDWFLDGPKSLIELFLIDNEIESLGQTVFAHLTNLTYLSISENKISKVYRSMFPNNLQVLDISYNEIKELPRDLFTNMHNLEDIYLEGNNITVLDEATWKPVWNQLDSVWLNDNPVVCDSQLRWILDYNFPKSLWGYCAEPPHLRGKHLTFLTPDDLV